MSTGYRFKRADALRAAEGLIEQISDQCHRVEIAGSLRRGKASVGDIELVALPVVDEREIAPVAQQMSLFNPSPNPSPQAERGVDTISRLDQVLDMLTATGAIFRDRPYTNEKGKWGQKQKQFWLPHLIAGERSLIKVDLYIVTPPAQWGPIFTIRTGDAEFTGYAGLMRWINERTALQQDKGRLIVRATGDVIQTPTERDYFRVIGLPWIEPHKRNKETIQKMFRIMRAPNTPFVNSGQNKIQNNLHTKIDSAGIVYTEGETVRAWIRRRLEVRAGIANA